MTVLLSHSVFRYDFADKATSAGSFTFVEGANPTVPDTITRSSGSFLTDGLLAGHRIQVSGSSSNNNYYFIDTLDNSTITLELTDEVTNEGPVSCSLLGMFIDKDGQPSWPIALMRSGGFSSGFTGIPTPYDAVAFEVTCNGGAADTLKNVPEYDWYLSQRTDVAASQHLSIAQKASTATSSYSGTVSIVHTTLASNTYTIASPINPTVQRNLFKYCHLYCRRRSDGAIQWVDLQGAMTTSY